MRYLIIDGNFFMYRAIHKMGELKRSDGKDTGLEYGFLRMLKTTVDEIKPNRVFVVFDGGISTLRLKILPEYKANRLKKGTSDRSILYKMLTSLGVSVFQYDGIEADDIIGLVSGLMDEGEELIIASSDTDFLQLINDNVKVYNPIKREYLQSPVLPKDYVMYKSMIGDTSDNITGISGIGPKKALKKLTEDIQSDPDGIIERNKMVISIPRNIVDFGCYYPDISWSSFQNNFDEWVSRKIERDFDTFFGLCRDMEFHSIETNRTDWQGSFGDRVTIDDLW